MLINRLPEILADRGLSIRELSRLTDITYTTIRAVYQSERRSVQLDVLEAICRVLKIQPGDIYILAEGNTEPALDRSPGGQSDELTAESARVKQKVPPEGREDWQVWK